MLDVYAENWLKEQTLRATSGEIAFSSVSKQRMIFDRYILEYFGRVDIREIGTRQVKDFNLHLAEIPIRNQQPMSPKYRDDILGVLRQMYNDALRSGDISRSQVPVFPSVEKSDPYFDFLTEEEQDQVMGEIPPYDRPIFHFILWYGVRPSETRALKRDCIFGEFEQVVIRRTFSKNNQLRETNKENRWRVLSLLDETKEILSALPHSLTGFLFVNRWGRPYSQDYLTRTWNTACKNAGFRYIPLYHGSRHSLGTKLAAEGYGENIIATVLGHSDTRTTKKYVRYASDSLKPFFKRRKVKKGTVTELALGKKECKKK